MDLLSLLGSRTRRTSETNRLALILLLLVAVGVFTGDAGAQGVVVVRGVPHVSFGSVAPADFDGDGDLDLMVIGQTIQGEPVSGLYTFNARLVEPIPFQAPRIVASYSRFAFTSRQMLSGDVAWGDIDGDGDEDVLVTGTALNQVEVGVSAREPATDLFENQDGRTLIIRSVALPALEQSRARWADIDADGDLDLALAGRDASGQSFLGLFEHDGAFGFSPITLDLPPLVVTDLEWGDYDGDGDADLLVTGDQAGSAGSLMLVNTGGGFDQVDPELPNWLFSSITAGDFDQDGDDDIVLSGGRLSPALMSGISGLFRSEGGRFVQVDVDLPATFAGNVEWGDLEGDGDLDLMLSGVTNLDRPDNQSIFVLEQEAGGFRALVTLQGTLFGSTTWFDYNDDGRLDIYATGVQENALVTTIYEF